MRTSARTVSDWRVNGYIGYQSTVTTSQISRARFRLRTSGGWGALSMPLWDTTIPYWFVVSGRRIIVSREGRHDLSDVYLGFYLPFASPNQYPYPLAVGGSFVGNTGDPEPRWSVTGNQSSNFGTALTARRYRVRCLCGCRADRGTRS
jgi:hypothetical protein